MVTGSLFLISFLLLFVDPNLTALWWGQMNPLKLFLSFFTYQLDHADFHHFLGNYMMLLPYGLYLESRMGSWRYAFLFFTCGVVAAVGQGLAPGVDLGLIGSSGSAFGVMMSAMLMYNGKWWHRWVSLSMISMLFLQQFTLAVSGFSNVGFWAHMAGGLAGVLLTYYYRISEDAKQTQLSKSSGSSKKES